MRTFKIGSITIQVNIENENLNRFKITFPADDTKHSLYLPLYDDNCDYNETYTVLQGEVNIVKGHFDDVQHFTVNRSFIQTKEKHYWMKIQSVENVEAVVECTTKRNNYIKWLRLQSAQVEEALSSVASASGL